jgi:hypothetical protein
VGIDEAAAIAAVLGVAIITLGYRNQPGVELSPDGRRYLAMAAGRRAPLPFALRWLLPAVCGTSLTRWRWSTAIHLVLLPPLLVVWLSRWLDHPGLLVTGGLLVCGLPGIFRIHLRLPVLVDAPAMAWALSAAIAAQHGRWPLVVALALLAGSVKEPAPIFAACYAWSVLPLVGLAAPLARRLVARLGDDVEGEDDRLAHPVRTGRLDHIGMWFDATAMATPWGACLLAILTTDRATIPMLVVTVLLAYGQLFIAGDTVRLYQWAAPPVILATITVIPPRWAVVALLAHLLNPWAGNGR